MLLSLNNCYRYKTVILNIVWSVLCQRSKRAKNGTQAQRYTIVYIALLINLHPFKKPGVPTFYPKKLPKEDEELNRYDAEKIEVA